VSVVHYNTFTEEGMFLTGVCLLVYLSVRLSVSKLLTNLNKIIKRGAVSVCD